MVGYIIEPDKLWAALIDRKKDGTARIGRGLVDEVFESLARQLVGRPVALLTCPGVVVDVLAAFADLFAYVVAGNAMFLVIGHVERCLDK